MKKYVVYYGCYEWQSSEYFEDRNLALKFLEEVEEGKYDDFSYDHTFAYLEEQD